IARLIGIEDDGLAQQRDGLRGVSGGFIGVGSEAPCVWIGVVAGDQRRENLDCRLVLACVSEGDSLVIARPGLLRQGSGQLLKDGSSVSGTLELHQAFAVALEGERMRSGRLASKRELLDCTFAVALLL